MERNNRHFFTIENLLLISGALALAGIAFSYSPFYVPSVAQALAPMICPQGGTVESVREPNAAGSVDLSFVCVDAQGRESDESPFAYLVLFTAWCWLPLIPAAMLVVRVWRWFKIRGSAPPQAMPSA
jgi:hypothetical protein